jgi:hypothetical protein
VRQTLNIGPLIVGRESSLVWSRGQIATTPEEDEVRHRLCTPAPTATVSSAYEVTKKSAHRQIGSIANRAGFLQSAPRTGRLRSSGPENQALRRQENENLVLEKNVLQSNIGDGSSLSGAWGGIHGARSGVLECFAER